MTETSLEDRRAHERISVLENSLNAHFVEHTQFIKTIEDTGKKVADALLSLTDVVKIYNNGRGAFELTKGIGKVVLWVSSIIIGISGSIAAIKFWVLP